MAGPKGQLSVTPFKRLDFLLFEIIFQNEFAYVVYNEMWVLYIMLNNNLKYVVDCAITMILYIITKFFSEHFNNRIPLEFIREKR